MYNNEGVLVDVDISISIIRDSTGKIVGSIGIVRDISERKAAENKLKELNSIVNMESDFISLIFMLRQ